jgi:hypothetical protein
MTDSRNETCIGITPERQAEVDAEVLIKLFSWTPPSGDQPDRYQRINAAALALAKVIHEVCTPGPDRTDAIRKVREARMTANASIATGGGFYR